MSSEEKHSAGGELVEQPAKAGELIERDEQMEAFGHMIGVSRSLEVSNFPSDPNENWKLTSLATDGAVKDSDAAIGKKIELVYAYLSAVAVAGETKGELIDAVRTVLFSADGERYGFVSAGVAMSVYRLFVRFGRKRFDPPIALSVEQRKTRRGFKITTLVPWAETA